jgi:hypothetical protein
MQRVHDRILHREQNKHYSVCIIHLSLQQHLAGQVESPSGSQARSIRAYIQRRNTWHNGVKEGCDVLAGACCRSKQRSRFLSESKIEFCIWGIEWRVRCIKWR